MPEEEIRSFDSHYIHVKAQNPQALQALNGLLVSAGVPAGELQDFIRRERGNCQVNGKTIRCTFSPTPAKTTVGFLFEVDRNFDAVYGEAMEAVSHPLIDYLTRAEANALPRPGGV